MNEPTLDDVKRFERKIYAVCVIGVGLGIFLISLFWNNFSILARIGRIAGFTLIVLSLLMTGYFFKLFRKLKGKMQDPFWKPEDGLGEVSDETSDAGTSGEDAASDGEAASDEGGGVRRGRQTKGRQTLEEIRIIRNNSIHKQGL